MACFDVLSQPLPLEAREWKGAWPPVTVEADDGNGTRATPMSPLLTIADNMRETLTHVRAFPKLAEVLRVEVNAVESLLEFARQESLVVVVDWRREVAERMGTASSWSLSAERAEELGRRILCGDGGTLPHGVRVEVEAARGEPRSWFALDVLVLVLDSEQAAEGTVATSRALGLEDGLEAERAEEAEEGAAEGQWGPGSGDRGHGEGRRCGDAPGGGASIGSAHAATTAALARTVLVDRLAERFPERGLDALLAAADVGEAAGNELAHLVYLSDAEVEGHFRDLAVGAVVAAAVGGVRGVAGARLGRPAEGDEGGDDVVSVSTDAMAWKSSGHGRRHPSDPVSVLPEKVMRCAARQVGAGAVFAAVERCRAAVTAATADDAGASSGGGVSGTSMSGAAPAAASAAATAFAIAIAGLAGRAGIDDAQVVLAGGLLPCSPHLPLLAAGALSSSPLPSEGGAPTLSGDIAAVTSSSVTSLDKRNMMPPPVDAESAFALDDEDEDEEVLAMATAEMQDVDLSQEGAEARVTIRAEAVAEAGVSASSAAASAAENEAADDDTILVAWRRRVLSAVHASAVRKMSRMAVEYVPLRRLIMERLRTPAGMVSSGSGDGGSGLSLDRGCQLNVSQLISGGGGEGTLLRVSTRPGSPLDDTMPGSGPGPPSFAVTRSPSTEHAVVAVAATREGGSPWLGGAGSLPHCREPAT